MSKLKWNLALVGLLAVSVLPIGMAHADAGSVSLTDVVIPACADPTINLRTVLPGFKCRTSKGAVFERVARDSFGEAWRDPNGLVWSNYVGTYSHHDAVISCKLNGGTLPSRVDFERAEASGFREVLSHMNDHWFWSSSVVSKGCDCAYFFEGKLGALGIDYRFFKGSVRCVSY